MTAKIAFCIVNIMLCCLAVILAHDAYHSYERRKKYLESLQRVMGLDILQCAILRENLRQARKDFMENDAWLDLREHILSRAGKGLKKCRQKPWIQRAPEKPVMSCYGYLAGIMSNCDDCCNPDARCSYLEGGDLEKTLSKMKEAFNKEYKREIAEKKKKRKSSRKER